MNMSKQKKELKKRAQSLKPVVSIGKSGLTENVIEELTAALKRDKLIKVKLAGGAIENYGKEGLLPDILKETKAQLIEKKGFTIVLYKP